MLLELKGVNGQIQLYEDRIIITRKGLMSKLALGLFKGEKTIYLNDITGIEFRLGSNLLNGYIQFTVPGGIESVRGVVDGSSDENTVMFYKKENDTAIQLKETIEKLKSKSKNQSNTTFSIADEIKKFKELLDEGVITKEEYLSMKKQLIDRKY